MFEFKRSLTVLIGFVILAGIAAITRPHASRGASGATNAPTTQTQNVNVVNTPTVSAQQGGTWNVGVNAMPPVAISNFPSTTNVAIQGTPVVGLDAGNNTVKFEAVNDTVKIDTSTPLLVRDVDNPDRQYFGNLRIIDLSDGEAGKSIFFSEVPAGKRLVIEEVSVNGYVPTGQSWQLVSLGVDHIGNTLDFDIEVKPRGVAHFSGGGRAQFAGSQQVRLYSDPGSTPRFVAQRNTTAGQARLVMTISGYFVDVP